MSNAVAIVAIAMVVTVRRRGVWWWGAVAAFPAQLRVWGQREGRAVVRRGGKGGLKTEEDGE